MKILESINLTARKELDFLVQLVLIYIYMQPTIRVNVNNMQELDKIILLLNGLEITEDFFVILFRIYELLYYSKIPLKKP